MFNPFKKKTQKLTWKHSVVGHEAFGVICSVYYWNLYEDQDGNRSFEKYHGNELDLIPDNADFSAEMQVNAWARGGNVPSCLFQPLTEKDLVLEDAA